MSNIISNMKDDWLCTEGKNGDYTINSAYMLISDLREGVERQDMFWSYGA